jgi:hypothetical protein
MVPSHGRRASRQPPALAPGRQHKRERAALGLPRGSEAGVRPVEHPVAEAGVRRWSETRLSPKQGGRDGMQTRGGAYAVLVGVGGAVLPQDAGRPARATSQMSPREPVAAARARDSLRGEPLVSAGGASGVLSGQSSRRLRSEQRLKALVAERWIGGTGPPSADGDRNRVVAQSLARDLRRAGACFSGVGGVDLTSRIGLGCDVVVEVEDVGGVVAALDLA